MTAELAYQLTNEQELWLIALESGNYRQTRYRLELNGAYCCLGVAAAVLGAKRTVSSDGYISYEGQTQLLPASVVKKLQLRNEGGGVKDINLDSLTYMNDFLDYSFADIADFIRKNPEKVFTNAN